MSNKFNSEKRADSANKFGTDKRIDSTASKFGTDKRIDSQTITIISKRDSFEDSGKINVVVTLSYCDEVLTANDVFVRINEGNTILLNEVIDDLINTRSYAFLVNSAISYFDPDLHNYVYCGIHPFTTNVLIPYQYFSGPSENYQIKIRSRQIIKKDNLMKMELAEENNENLDENNQNMFINHKSKRSKERKIGYIIEKVFLWRKLYNGFLDEKGNLVKLTLEESADRVGISKKSLDDYLIQLRIGKQFGFIFNEHKNDKVGVLRAFVKKHKFLEENKSVSGVSVGNINPGNFYHTPQTNYPSLSFQGEKEKKK
jgi:hypothetical protein